MQRKKCLSFGSGILQRVKKVLADFFARFKNAMFFVKLHFTKNLAVLVKKSDKSDVFDGYLSNSRIARRRCRWQIKARRNFRSRTACAPPQCRGANCINGKASKGTSTSLLGA